MLLEVTIVSVILAGVGWGWLRWSRHAFEQKYGKPADSETDARANAN
ncbi:hypothetical protein LOK46_25565 [Methylobacterium sp. NMS14P]|nr:hypothetical protein [Methylobacterium sp. NMS14P]WCS24463.1 hypothetical protein LOK46_25565 [Methylobacterium sp. NMS14P]